ncbi:hypothetical protein JW890_08915 [candidate division WOR-3 bacterium]|nr:hypothetical protein [candidate division WOR-3 bacterium]
MNFVRSVSGYRGVVGDGFDPEVVVRYVNAFSEFLGDGSVCLGRDPRKTGEQFSKVAAGTLTASGRDVFDLGVVPTPTVLINVKKGKHAGAVIVTASHNPEKWNALKFVKEGGVFLNAKDVEKLFSIADAGYLKWKGYAEKGFYEKDFSAEKKHLNVLINSGWMEDCSGLNVVIDSAGGASAEILPELCRKMGCTVKDVLGKDKSGKFTRDLEPIPENLNDLSARIKKFSNTIGLATDTDGDRLALVDENGLPVGEEKTLQLAVLSVLEKQKGTVVANVSTSSAVRIIAEKEKCRFVQSPVGEGKVVEKMIENSAVIGGEGNGGVIFPEIHPARDAQTAAVLVLGYLKRHKLTLKDAIKSLPKRYMLKKKIENADFRVDPSLFSDLLKNSEFIGIDGIKWQDEKSWFHIRKSGTENAVRVIVETDDENETQKLAKAVLERLKKCAE